MKCKKLVKFSESSGYQPCGQCFSCRMTKQWNWVSRLMFEYRFSMNRCTFVTLTYAPEHLPDSDKYLSGNLCKRDVQLFIKRFRRHYGNGRRVSYYAVGEYGEKTQRAHYHLLLFNVEPLFIESLVKKSWTLGNVKLAPLLLSDGSAYTRIRYTLGYTLKKMTSEKDFQDGRQPEFSLSSKNPAIGLGYLQNLKPFALRHHYYLPLGLSMFQRWYFEAYYPDLEPWRGNYELAGKRYALDRYLSKKMNQLLYPDIFTELSNREDEFITCDAYFSWKEREHSYNYSDMVVSVTSEEQRRSIVKSEKQERRFIEKNLVRTNSV